MTKRLLGGAALSVQDDKLRIDGAIPQGLKPARFSLCLIGTTEVVP
jgi:hypothetical protein